SGPPAVHVRPPSGERESQSATCLPRYPKQVKYAVPPSGLNATAGSPPKSYVPVPGTAGSFVNCVMPGMKPLGSVGVHVLPPSNVALTPQPSLKFQSLLPVIMLLGFAGLTASGVSFWAVVSRL